MESDLPFEWDVHNIRHLARHGVTPEEFEEAMRNDPFVDEAYEHHGEERYSAVAPTNGLRMLRLTFTYRNGRVRPISAWDAPNYFRDLYFQGREGGE